MKAAVDVVTKGQLPGHLPALTRYLEPAVRQAQGKQASDLVDAAIRQNVLLNAEQLRSSEPVMAGLVKAKKVGIVGAIYDLATGRVTVLPNPRETANLNAARRISAQTSAEIRSGFTKQSITHRAKDSQELTRTCNRPQKNRLETPPHPDGLDRIRVAPLCGLHQPRLTEKR